jgi:hypothetical protein
MKGAQGNRNSQGFRGGWNLGHFARRLETFFGDIQSHGGTVYLLTFVTEIATGPKLSLVVGPDDTARTPRAVLDRNRGSGHRVTLGCVDCTLKDPLRPGLQRRPFANVVLAAQNRRKEHEKPVQEKGMDFSHDLCFFLPSVLTSN